MNAIIPAAGKGTRMAEIASDRSKEMLPLAGQTVLDFVFAEARLCVNSEIRIVTSESKIDVISFAQSHLAAVLFQPIQNGLAPAIALGLDSNESALVLLPDTIFHPSAPSRKLKEAVENGADVAIAVELIGDERVSQYGIVEFDPTTHLISRILEKPSPSETPSRWAVSARYAFSAKATDFLKGWIAGHIPEIGELSITPAIQAALDAGFSGVAVPLETEMVRYDCGNPAGYAKALKEIQ